MQNHIDPSLIAKSLVADFYDEFGIRQNHSFSGGFRFIEKNRPKPVVQEKKMEDRDLYKEFGLSKTNLESYKIDKEYVPDTKEELADKLI